jgi:hypothetical protein
MKKLKVVELYAGTARPGRRPGHGAPPLVDFAQLACLVILFKRFEIGSSQ